MRPVRLLGMVVTLTSVAIAPLCAQGKSAGAGGAGAIPVTAPVVVTDHSHWKVATGRPSDSLLLHGYATLFAPPVYVTIDSMAVDDCVIPPGQTARIDSATNKPLIDSAARVTALVHTDSVEYCSSAILEAGAAPMVEPRNSNVGNVTIGSIIPPAKRPPETITITMTGLKTFSVTGSVRGNLGTGTVGVPFTSPVVSFIVRAGRKFSALHDTYSFRNHRDAWVPAVTPGIGNVGNVTIDSIAQVATGPAETITITMTGRETFRVKQSGSGKLSRGTVGRRFTSPVVDFTVHHADTVASRKGDLYSFRTKEARVTPVTPRIPKRRTVRIESIAPGPAETITITITMNGPTTFSVWDSRGASGSLGRVLGQGTVGEPFTSPVVSFTVHGADTVASRKGDTYSFANSRDVAGTAVTAGRTNVGNATIGSITPPATGAPENITITMTASTKFSVWGSVSGNLGGGDIGRAFTSAVVGFTVIAGAKPGMKGDTYSFLNATDTAGRAVTAGNANVGNATICGITPLAPTPPPAKGRGETITITMTGLKTFSVTGSVSRNLGTGTVGVPFTSAVVDFTVKHDTVANDTSDTYSFWYGAPIRSMNRQDEIGVTESTCATFAMEFMAQTGAATNGNAAPTTVPTRWMTIPDTDGSRKWACAAEYRWRFGDAPGNQMLSARAVAIDTAYHPCLQYENMPPTSMGSAASADSIVCKMQKKADSSSYVRLRAVAHTLPGPILGGAVNAHGSKQSSKFTPVVGLDFAPVMLLPGSWQNPSWMGRIRAILATDTDGHSIYGGLQLGAVAFGPAAGASPVQVAIGYRWALRGDSTGGEGIFFMAYLNAASLLTSITGLLTAK